MNKVKTILGTLILFILIFGIFALCVLTPPSEYSSGERRLLTQMPELSIKSLVNGEFTEEFEKYTADQFPFRDRFRSLKALFSTRVLSKLDNNGLFIKEGHISKIDEEENEYMMNYSAEKFHYIADNFIKDKNAKLYFSIVPDKNFFLAEKNGYPSLDYYGFIEKMRNKTEFMKYIDITSMLELDDYYTTDTHWRQERITDIADFLADAMDVELKSEYEVKTLNNDFYGVYHGQLAMPFKPDKIKYLTNDILESATVTYYDTGLPRKSEMYNMEKAYGKDPYEMFLSGSMPLVTIENPQNDTGRELVMFRDSFGSSLAPLMVEGYSKITVVDIRYIQSAMVGNFVDFEDCDVLFIYSTALLNNSTAMR